MRAWLRNWLASTGVDPRDTYDIVLAVQEAASNAFSHVIQPAGSVLVTVTFRQESIWIEVADQGQGLDLESRDTGRCPSVEMERGRGLYLMRRLVDVVECVPLGAGSLIRLGKCLPPEQAAA
jgi:anti-sigma regulatory factor (Ser/Thr protein kinase)